MKNEQFTQVAPQEKMPLRQRMSLRGARAVRDYFTTASHQLLDDHKVVERNNGTKTAVEALLSTPLAQEILSNDGEKTYLMHGTTIEKAEDILEKGLMFFGYGDDYATPNLSYTAKMMPGRHEYGAKKRIEHGVTYRFAGGFSAAKVVIEFDKPNPGTSLNKDQFANTELLEVDGHNISVTDDEKYPFVIPAGRVVGYFNLDTGVFVQNPHAKEDEDLS